MSPEDSCVFYRSTEGGGLPPKNILSQNSHIDWKEQNVIYSTGKFSHKNIAI